MEGSLEYITIHFYKLLGYFIDRTHIQAHYFRLQHYGISNRPQFLPRFALSKNG